MANGLLFDPDQHSTCTTYNLTQALEALAPVPSDTDDLAALLELVASLRRDLLPTPGPDELGPLASAPHTCELAFAGAAQSSVVRLGQHLGV